MKLAFVELNGFRGYREPLRLDFADRFTIIDGRNGTGKSTVFDAIEFALTGKISKYDGVSAAGETFEDYVWWRGAGPQPASRYVRVGFRDEKGVFEILRGEFKTPDSAVLDQVLGKLCDRSIAPANPLPQLCQSTIVRDEHITALSMDLGETDRYALLRGTLGANDSPEWIERAAAVVAAAKKRLATAQNEVTQANSDLSLASRRLDQTRSSLVADNVMAQVVERLRAFAESGVPPDQLAGAVRAKIGEVLARMDALKRITAQWNEVVAARAKATALEAEAKAAATKKQEAQQVVDSLEATPKVEASSLAEDARKLVHLVTLGRHFGLRDGSCPLCSQAQSKEVFENGLRAAEEVARRWNDGAVKAARAEQLRTEALARLAGAKRTADAAEVLRANVVRLIEEFDRQRAALGISELSLDQLGSMLGDLGRVMEAAQQDLRVLETLRLNVELELAQRGELDSKARLAKAQEKLSRARKAEAGANALHDAARRAASETLDRRLERVLPLMSEMYRRLRPHAVWNDIEYAIRGDVRKFLSLKVGEDLNPQFLFSSGQRRATGLAFLLSVNLSLAWSKWRSILLDDPVQHVDDYRAVHLAELLAHLVASGRQVICAVEDAALADLMCRRLPIESKGAATRITLGAKQDGMPGKLDEHPLAPPMRSALLPVAQKQVG